MRRVRKLEGRVTEFLHTFCRSAIFSSGRNTGAADDLARQLAGFFEWNDFSAHIRLTVASWSNKKTARRQGPLATPLPRGSFRDLPVHVALRSRRIPKSAKAPCLGALAADRDSALTL